MDHMRGKGSQLYHEAEETGTEDTFAVENDYVLVFRHAGQIKMLHVALFTPVLRWLREWSNATQLDTGVPGSH